jgi:hypothetical protein
MIRAYLLVKDQTDVDFLRRVLPPELMKDVEFVPTGENSGGLSLARTLVARRRTPVAMFMRTKTLDADLMAETVGGSQELLQMAAGRVPAKVIVAVPDLEAYFFDTPDVIERVLGEKVPDEFVFLGKRDPQGVLELLSKRANRKWDLKQAVDLLDPRDIERLQAAPPVAELNKFLHDVLGDGKAA